MPEYRRVNVKGGTYFFTVVTYERRPIFKHPDAIYLLKECLEVIKGMHPYDIKAIVILPDHLHTIWTLPENDSDYSKKWQMIKSSFSKLYRDKRVVRVRDSYVSKGEKGIWQRRFWEHLIKDQSNFNRLCDYIHYNPVKHGLVYSPSEYEFSSFQDFVTQGVYSSDWGNIPTKNITDMELE